jgi:RNase H-like domain found in reverse transcriptase
MVKKTGTNYTTIKREVYAIVKSLLHFTYIRTSRKNYTVILIDHRNFLFLSGLNISRIQHISLMRQSQNSICVSKIYQARTIAMLTFSREGTKRSKKIGALK